MSARVASTTWISSRPDGLAVCEQHEGKNGDDLMVREPNMASGWRRTVEH